MKTLFLAILFLASCGGDPPSDPPSAGGEWPVRGPFECVTCNRGLTDPSCNLCGLCATRRAQGIVTEVGCLPGGPWCSNPDANSCRQQDCAACP